MNLEMERPAATILVVDDNAQICASFATVLRTYGYNVHAADGGEAALRIVAEHQPDLILLDIMMPDMSGLEVERRLDEHPSTAAIPVIAVTALAKEALVMDPSWDRFAGYLQKPVSLPDFVRALRTALSAATERAGVQSLG